MHGPDESPAYVLANAGYDVWLCNTRGNKYSDSHVTFDQSQEQFWNYSFVDYLQDSQANIEYVLNYTDSETVGYVAHSLGTAGFITALTRENDWYRDRISIFIGIGSVAQFTYTTSPYLEFFANARFLIPTLRRFGIYYLFPVGLLYNPFYLAACEIYPVI